MNRSTSTGAPPAVVTSSRCRLQRRARLTTVGIVGIVVLLVAALVWVSGCGTGDGGAKMSGEDVSEATVYYNTSVTSAARGDYVAEENGAEAMAPFVPISPYGVEDGVVAHRSNQKVITNASLQVEVEEGTFQTAFEQTRLLADKYGGYVVSANSSASGKENVMRSGVVTIRVPSQSLNLALEDVLRLGKTTAQQVDSQDVTEEYVDLESRLKNAQTQEQALLSLMGQASTVEETLRVRDVLYSVQREIEQLKGRLAYLEEHSSFSTLTVSLYESGAVATKNGGWGFIQALKDAVRALVRTVNELLVFLGGALPVLVLLVLIGWVVYLITRAVLRQRDRRRSEQIRAYQAQQAAYHAEQSTAESQASAAPEARRPGAGSPS